VVADIQQNKQRELGFVQPGEEKAVRRPHCSLPVFKRGYEKDKNQLSTGVDSYRTRGSGLEIHDP